MSKHDVRPFANLSFDFLLQAYLLALENDLDAEFNNMLYEELLRRLVKEE